MYKKQLRFQKIVCLLAIISAAITFVYALGIITDIYDSLYSTMRNPNDLLDTKVTGSIIYYDMQDFNKQYVNLGIGLILAACFVFITNTHVRRKYYIGNYVATGLYSAAAVGVCIWSHLQITGFKHQFLTTVNFEEMKKYSDLYKSLYLEDTFLLDLHYLVAAISLVSVAGLIFNMIWKIRLMRGENQLIEAGKEAAV